MGKPSAVEAISKWQAVARIHQSLFTGLLLRVLLEAGVDKGAAFLNRTFHWQHDEKFLPALKSLGLDQQPHAVACAQFFYLANHVGGVDVTCMVESDRKAWIRYPPPRWAYMDAAICAVPNDVTIAMMRGFHARCGESLGNPCLGFVCTKMTSNGDPGLEGYFIEEAAALAPEERLRFQPDECPPPFDPAQLPVIGWDEARNAKARRNYSLNYIRQMLPAMRAVIGEGFGSDISRRAARLVGLQLFAETSQILGGVESGRPGFAAHLAAMLEGCGDEVMVENESQQTVITQSGWRMMRGSKRGTFADFTAWAELWRGACVAHDAQLSLRVTQVDASDIEPARAQYRWVLTG